MTSSIRNSDLQKLIELNKRVTPESDNAQELSAANVQKLIELNQRFSAESDHDCVQPAATFSSSSQISVPTASISAEEHARLLNVIHQLEEANQRLTAENRRLRDRITEIRCAALASSIHK